MQNNKEETFWSNDEESDEDFESIINTTKNNSKTTEVKKTSGMLSSEKMDFLWSDEEEAYEENNDENTLFYNTTKNLNLDIKHDKDLENTDKYIEVEDDYNNNNNKQKYNYQYETSHDKTNETCNISKFNEYKDEDNKIIHEDIVTKTDYNDANDLNINISTEIIDTNETSSSLTKNQSLQEETLYSFDDKSDCSTLQLEEDPNNLNFKENTIESPSEGLLTDNLPKKEDEDIFNDNSADDETFFYNTLNKSAIQKNENLTINILSQETKEDVSSVTKIDDTSYTFKEDTKPNINAKLLDSESNANDLIDNNSVYTKINNIQKTSFDLNSPIPLVCVLRNKVVTYYETKQKRYTTNGEQKEHVTNFISTYNMCKPSKLELSSLPGSYENYTFDLIHSILNIKDIHADNVSALIGAKPVQYTSKSFESKENMVDINIALNMSIYNRKLAVDYCIKRKMWTIALMLSDMDPNVKSLIYEEIIDKEMISLFSETNFTLKKPWKDYFMHFVNGKSGILCDKYISEVFKVNYDSGFLVLVSLHLCKVIELKDYLGYFSHKHHLLHILIYIDKNYNKIDNLDLLLYEYICDIKDRDLELAKDLYKKYKKQFSKKLQNLLDENFKLNWNFGIKDMLNFGISKILDVSENDLKDKNGRVELNNKINTEKVNQDIKVKKDIFKKEFNDIYSDQKHSKSFADVFEMEKEEQVVTTEDDTALFLSKYTVEDDLKAGIRKDESVVSDTENKGSFLSMFNIFKKKSYKIDVKASDDIKYDPITKRWVSTSNTKREEEEVIPKKELPIPKIKLPDNKNTPVKKNIVDIKKMSLYAGKKKTSTTSFSTIKKDIN